MGAGGAGKTRLAIEAASRNGGNFADGVCLADLAGLTDPRLVSRAIASALEIPEEPRRPIMATLSDRLRNKRLLLVMDNCEHLLAECAAVADSLLKVCGGLTIMVTSRRPLSIGGEVVFRVPSLPAPPEAEGGKNANEYDAVRLFVERAQQIQPLFRLTTANAEAVAKICRRLDGIPLAIELAAVRLNVLTAEQIDTRLDDRFRLLVAGSRTALPRHRTLRALIDWSFDLLEPSEQEAWCRLCVFAGDFGLDAAEEVATGGAIERSEVLNLLAKLAEQSIVNVHEDNSEARYRMLETLRQYGIERVKESGGEVELRQRHLQWVLALCELAESEWRGPNQAVWLARLDRELDNIRAALDWANHQDDHGQAGLRIATALWLFWQVRGHHGEGRLWLEALLGRDHAPTALRGKAINVAGFLAYGQGETAVALRLLEESLVIGQALGDDAAVALALLRLGIGAYYHGDLQRAVAVLEEALGRYRAMGDRVGTHVALYELAEALSYAGEYARARELHEEGVALKRQIGDSWHVAFSLFGLSLLDFLEGRFDDAAMKQRECLRMRRDLDDRWGIAICLEVMAWVEGARGMYRAAARLLGAADAARTRMGASLIAPHLRNHVACVESTRRVLGPAAFSLESQLGEKLDADEAIRLAIGESMPKTRATATVGGLTPREVQIARLVAEGLTNRQIGQKLSIAERTVDAHVEHVKDKLGFRSRLEIARWADARNAPA